MAETFIGAGIAFPVRLDQSGRVALVSGEREIEESIRLIIGTAHGERPMRPDFGCGIHDFLFASVDATTAGLVAFDVRSALTRWETRIEVEDVVVSNDDQPDGNRILIDITYSIRGSNDPRNLVFPFYSIPEE